MYLKALEIQGFKSFPDKTHIQFKRGITAVVGPNGSGKSNLSDAVRWVLGETSMKQLRGGGRMENVIFGGTLNRNPMGYTSVQLILDNKKRGLDVDADEVAIGRKYYRSGNSEYSINGQSVRLRDVYEMLLDTGLGRDGYSIIGQGRIAEIVGAKSAERREIFEEASGIARFRYRKEEAEKRLMDTEENLLRLRDILDELEARVGPLKRQSEKAKRFLELSEEKKALEITLWLDTLRSTTEKLRGHQRKMEIASGDYAAKKAAAEKIEEQNLGLREEIEQIIIKIDRSNAAIRGYEQQLSSQDAKLAVLQNNIEHNQTSIANLRREINESGAAEGATEKEIEAQKQQLQAAEAETAKVQKSIEECEAALTEMQRKSLESGEKKGELQALLAALTDDATSCKMHIVASENTIETAEKRLADQQDGRRQSEQLLAELDDEQTALQEALQAVEQQKTKLKNIEQGLELKLNSRTDAFEKAQNNLQQLTAQQQTAVQRVDMLQDLERNLDGFQASVKTVIQSARQGRLRGIIGPVSSILSVQPGYEIAIETALGYSLQNIVVQDESAAKAAMAFLKQNNGGRATFLPLDTVKPRHFDASNLPHGAQSAQQLVQYDAAYESIVSSLLARIVVVEDIHKASSVARTLNYRNRVVTQDGQVINAGGSFTGGSVSRSAGLFSRKKEIKELQDKQTALKERLKDAEAAKEEIAGDVAKLRAQYTATNSELITAGEEKIRAEGELKRAATAYQTAKQNAEQQHEVTAQLEKQRDDAQQERQQQQQKQQHLNDEINRHTAALAAIAGDDDSFLEEREKLSSRLSALRLEALGFERDADLCKNTLETLRSRTGEQQEHRQNLHDNIKALEEQIETHEAEKQTVKTNTEEAAREIKELEQTIETLAASRIEKEGHITAKTREERTLNDERESLGREIATLSEQQTNLETRYDSTLAKLWDDYELTPQAAQAFNVPFESVTALRSQVGELRGSIRALGHVNVGAIEEYKEVNERYTFLKEQMQDVELSKNELEQMIAEISGEMTTMFAESFAEINKEFSRIFKELFGGGSATLYLSDPDDLLSSGIEIDVAPPGKIINDLGQLSGGEQSLVAICIYFAILAVNPSPFCLLDEIDAALDEANVNRFAQYLRYASKETQFIIITHRRGTMEEADILYGVTMQEDGISKMLRLDVADVDVSMLQ